MKNIKKLLSIFLIFIICLSITVSGAACDLSNGNIHMPAIVEYDETEYLDETEDQSDFPDRIRFYKYLNIFDNAQNIGSVSVNSQEMFAAYIEYANFYAVKKKVGIVFNYDAKDFKEEYAKAEELYESGDRLAIGYEAAVMSYGKWGYYRINKSAADNLATKTFDEDREFVSDQVSYALKMVAPNKRDEDYDDFKLNERTKLITNVKNSEQLRWAISNGYNPQCVEGSAAERVLESAKAVLREIVSDEMDDLAKLRAIYEWLALNVSYDHLAAQELQADTDIKASEYDAWYAEGVFDNRKAVCEGYAKALVIMAGLEGIPAIFITGDGHAWNRVMLNGKWYVVDATHADVHVEDSEMFSYASFLITDAEKANRGYTGEQYSDLTATTEYNIFDFITVPNDENDYDLIIDSKAELKAVLEYANSLLPNGKHGTVDVFVKAGKLMNFKTWLNDIFNIKPLYNNVLTPDKDVHGNAHYTFYL
nr:transglutaminase domain-containing protein [Clostridia bacterium]